MNTEVRPLNFMPRDHSPLILNRPETRDKLRGTLHRISTDQTYRKDFIEARAFDESVSANGLVYRLLRKGYFSELSRKFWAYISEANKKITDLAMHSEENRAILKRPIICNLMEALLGESQEVATTHHGLMPNALPKMLAYEPGSSPTYYRVEYDVNSHFEAYTDAYAAAVVAGVIVIFAIEPFEEDTPPPTRLTSQEIRSVARIVSLHVQAKIANAAKLSPSSEAQVFTTAMEGGSSNERYSKH